jgi:predicted DNA-binding transcriptional regulator AlpA
MASKQDKIQFLETYQKKLVKAYDTFWQLMPCDLVEPLTKREIIAQLLDYAKGASIRAEKVKNQIRAAHLRKYAELLANPVFCSKHADRIIARREKVEERRLAKVERVARLADDYDFDGSLFRELIPPDDPLSVQEARKLRKQIETIPKIIAAIERPINKSIIPEGAELLSVAQVATMLGWGESVVRQRDKDGLLPMPYRFGGTVQWSRKELESWINAGCPNRQQWENQKQRKGA